MWPNRRFTVNLAKFTEEILNRKLHFLCGGISWSNPNLKIALSFTFLIIISIIDNLYFKILSDKTSDNEIFLEAKSEAKNLFRSFWITNQILIKMDLSQLHRQSAVFSIFLVRIACDFNFSFSQSETLFLLAINAHISYMVNFSTKNVQTTQFKKSFWFFDPHWTYQFIIHSRNKVDNTNVIL